MLNSKPSNRASSPRSAAPTISAISSLKFPFKLTKDQIKAVDAWINRTTIYCIFPTAVLTENSCDILRLDIGTI
jgi:hypothetical protein